MTTTASSGICPGRRAPSPSTVTARCRRQRLAHPAARTWPVILSTPSRPTTMPLPWLPPPSPYRPPPHQYLSPAPLAMLPHAFPPLARGLSSATPSPLLWLPPSSPYPALLLPAPRPRATRHAAARAPVQACRPNPGHAHATPQRPAILPSPVLFAISPPPMHPPYCRSDSRSALLAPPCLRTVPLTAKFSFTETGKLNGNGI
ncbi:hypothetical protein B0H14DRAFT_3878948 [Mycena olivaceomarginata]|nr:hypothetical protein B0H14DRAFT_3878948 [Mycena olivaceomarginata]